MLLAVYFLYRDFPGGVVGKSLADAGDPRDVGLTPELGRTSGERKGNPL